MSTADPVGADRLQAHSAAVRPDVSSDLTAIHALLATSRLPTEALTDRPIPRFLMAAARAEIVGCVALEPCGSVGLLRSLAVWPTTRGQGAARRLVDAIEARARGGGMLGLYLLTTTAETLFSHLGYLPQTLARRRIGARVPWQSRNTRDR